MAFVGIFLMFLVVIVISVSFCTFLAAVFFVIAAIISSKNKKKVAAGYTGKLSKAPVVLRALSAVFILPLVVTVVLVAYIMIGASVKSSHSLYYQVMDGNYENAEKLLDKGTSPDLIKESDDKDMNKYGMTILAVMAQQNGYDKRTNGSLDDEERKMAQLLVDNGADLESRYYVHENHYFTENNYYVDGCGSTPLLIAVRNGNYDMVEFLVENGADVNAVDEWGYNSVAVVADQLSDERGYYILEYLLENGADKTCRTKWGEDVVYLAEKNEKDNEKIIKLLRDENE